VPVPLNIKGGCQRAGALGDAKGEMPDTTPHGVCLARRKLTNTATPEPPIKAWQGKAISPLLAGSMQGKHSGARTRTLGPLIKSRRFR
jgi:hypothetical protein